MTTRREAAAREKAHELLQQLGRVHEGGGCSSAEDRLTAYLVTLGMEAADKEEDRQDWRTQAIVTANVAAEREQALTADRDTWRERAEKAERSSEGWERMAAHAHEGGEFYRGLVREIGRHFGAPAFTSDDGSVQDDVLALCVPELVAGLRAALGAAEARALAAEGRGTADPVALAVAKGEVSRVSAELDKTRDQRDTLRARLDEAERTLSAVTEHLAVALGNGHNSTSGVMCVRDARAFLSSSTESIDGGTAGAK